jgi:S-adenosylmethionine hydrolase
MTAVEKTGSTWKGEITTVTSEGNFVSNVPASDVLAFAQISKIWMELGPKPVVIRGVLAQLPHALDGKVVAVAGPSGFIEFIVSDGKTVVDTGLSKGDSVVVRFRT